MATEIEAKLKVPALDPIRERLRACGAQRVGCVIETNYILDRADQPLWQRDAALRVRGVEVLDGPRQPARLTYKGPAQAGRFKARQEIEVEIADARRAVELLAAVGLTVALCYEKRRETWRFQRCLVELDKLPVLGDHVEIEGPDDAAIDAVRARLGLAATPHVPESYVAMLAAHGRSAGLTDWTFRLPAERPG